VIVPGSLAWDAPVAHPYNTHPIFQKTIGIKG
jgi:hypothetical protein